MLTALHLLIYSDDANATRAFLRDVLGWQCIEDTATPGWLIFKTGPSELGVHPTRSTYEGREHVHARHHSIALMCDDLEATRAALGDKGAMFSDQVEEEWGRSVLMRVPGADDLMLYEPRHPTAYDL